MTLEAPEFKRKLLACPTAVFELDVVFLSNALEPTATFVIPVVFNLRALAPTAVLRLPPKLAERAS